ncbi:MAG: esterase/lipase family protein [Bdellovibrionales bacterium]
MSKDPSLKHAVLYFRGLNTQGDEQLRFGRLALGPMHGPWLEQLHKRHVTALPVPGRGGGPLQEQIEKAVESIRRLPLWQSPETRFHFLAHSTGGLVARAAVHHLRQPSRILSVVTLAAPHQGSWLAELIPSVPERRPRLNRLLQLIDYRIEKKLAAFADLTPMQAKQFNSLYPDVPGIRYGSAIFAIPEKKLSWPVRFAKRIVDTSEAPMSDGIVALDAQNWGEVFFKGQLDHMNQIGYNFRLLPHERLKTNQEFLRLVDKVVDFMHQSES